MLWCHTCRLTYEPPAVMCRACGGALTGTQSPDPAHTHTLIMIAVVTGAALMVSAALFVARWLLSGSPLPR